MNWKQRAEIFIEAEKATRRIIRMRRKRRVRMITGKYFPKTESELKLFERIHHK